MSEQKLEIPSRIMTLGDWRRWWLSVEDRDVDGAWDVKLIAVEGLVAELQKPENHYHHSSDRRNFVRVDWLLELLGAKK